MKEKSSVNIQELPLVSIIIPSFNRSNLIKQTIDSVINQVCSFNIEIVIGDDFSTDKVREDLLKYQQMFPKQIVLLFHKSNIGLGANWATCLMICKGKYICNCDNDDYWHNPNKLQLQYDFMEAHPEVGVLHTNFRTHNRTNGKITEQKAYINDNQITTQRALFNGDYRICNATMMYRKDVIDSNLNLDDYIVNKFTLQDWNTWVILAKYTKFYCLPVSTATFGIETVSITRPDSYDKILSRMTKEKECYEYVCSLYPEDLIFNSLDYDKYINRVLLSFAFTTGDFLKAKELSHSSSNKLKRYITANRFFFSFYLVLMRMKKRLQS